MRRLPRIVLWAVLIGAMPVMAGCSSFDPDSLDIFGLNEKKKLPGERRDLFPEGVPGVSQGIPPEYLRSNQAPGAMAPAEGAAPQQAALPVEPPKPAAQPRPQPRRTATRAPARPAAAAPVTPVEAQPAPAAQQQAPAQSGWPAQGGTAAQPSGWPAPQPSGTFQR